MPFAKDQNVIQTVERDTFGWSRSSASSVTKNDYSIALSCPQNRTARRVGSKTRLWLGKLIISSG